jgi:hypothetical protein
MDFAIAKIDSQIALYNDERLAEQEVKLLLVEPRGVLNTGHEGGERTADSDVWI